MATAFLSSNRQALLIGNNKYDQYKLQRCQNDVEDIGKALTDIGFETTMHFDLNYIQMKDAINDFVMKINEGDFVIFFYSGHGAEWENEHYLIPINNAPLIERPNRHEGLAISTQWILQSIKKEKPFVIVFLLDCCRTPIEGAKGGSLQSDFTSPTVVKGVAGALIVFACGPNEKTFERSRNNRNSLFTYHLLEYIKVPNLKVEEMMSRVCHGVYEDSGEKLFTYRLSTLRTSKIYFNKTEKHSVVQNIRVNSKWTQNGVTVAGGHGEGKAANQLNEPYGIFVDDDQTVFIADCWNHRIIQSEKGDMMNGQVVAGGKGQGIGFNQLNQPTDVLIDKETNSVIVCDRKNRRVIRWSRRGNKTQGEILIDNITCWGLAMDESGYIYVSDHEKHEVRRYRSGEKNGTIVAGGNGKGANLNQLNEPTYLFVDRQQNVYVSDIENHRVMKWNKGAKEGIVVAGGQGNGNALTQMNYPYGLSVDTSGILYVADSGNNRIMRWTQGAQQGTVIVGGNGRGDRANQFNCLRGLSFDRHGNLYVADVNNNRVQRFSIE